MPQNVKKKFNLVPLSCSRIEWRCFEVDEIFPGSTSCALFVWKMSFEIPIFCLDKLINSCTKSESFWARNLERSKTVFPILYSFSKKNAMKMKMLFSIQPNDLGFWCIQLMHSNFEFSDAPDPKCLGAPRALLVFWSKKILSETDCLSWSLSDNLN